VERAASGSRMRRETPTVDEKAAVLSKHAHLIFDEMSRTASEPVRDRRDLIAEEVFDKIDAAIDGSGAQKIIDVANKHLFHAADELSRKRVQARHLSLILAELTEVHANLAAVANYILVKLVGEGPCVTGVATAQFNVLARLDQLFIEAERADELLDWWSKHTTPVG
jgi:hypothetical protein